MDRFRFSGFDKGRFPAWLRQSIRSIDQFDTFLRDVAEFFRRRGLKPGDPAPIMTKVRTEPGVAVQRRPTYALFDPIACQSYWLFSLLTAACVSASSQKQTSTSSLDVDLANVYGRESTLGKTPTIGPLRTIGSALDELVSRTCGAFIAHPIIGGRLGCMRGRRG